MEMLEKLYLLYSAMYYKTEVAYMYFIVFFLAYNMSSQEDEF
jgi:hypothetical protein